MTKGFYPKANIMVGHGGMNYASQTLLTGFNNEFKYSMVLSMNTLNGQSCQQLSKNDSIVALSMLECLIQDKTIQYFSEGKGPKLNCTQSAYSF